MRSYTRAQLVRLARADAKRYGLDADIFVRQITQESNFDPNARSGAGAEGVGQFMPATAAGFHIDPYEPVQALDAAARMDSGNLKKYGSYERMLSAYNSGRPDKYKDPNFAHGQTYNYVRSIMGGKTPTVGPPAKGDLVSQARQAVSGGVDYKKAMVGYLLQASQSALQGGMPDYGGLLQLAQLRQQLQAATPAPGALGGAPGSSGPIKPGKVQWLGKSLDHVDPAFAQHVATAAHAAGATQIRVNSGYRSPEHNAAVGGVSHSNHMFGHAIDGEAFVPGKGWVPLGSLLRTTAGRFGLRSGDQPGFYRGGRDTVHVDDNYNATH